MVRYFSFLRFIGMAVLAAVLLVPLWSRAQEAFETYVAGLPAATLPLGVGDQFWVLQGGLPKRVVTGAAVGGLIVVRVRSSSGPTVTASASNDYFLCLDPTANAITVNLPVSPATGLSYLVKDCTGQSAVHAITIVPASGNIDGSASAVIGIPYQSFAVTYTGVQWSLN